MQHMVKHFQQAAGYAPYCISRAGVNALARFCPAQSVQGCFVTAESHNVKGGLGNAISEVLTKYRRCPIEMVGLQDVFSQSDTPDALPDHYDLNEEAITLAAQ